MIRMLLKIIENSNNKENIAESGAEVKGKVEVVS